MIDLRFASNQKNFKLYSRPVRYETAVNQHLQHLFFTCGSALAASRRPRPGRARVRCVNHYLLCYANFLDNKKERQSARLCILHYLNRYRRMRNCFNPILMLISVFNVTIGLCPPAYTPDKQGHTQMTVDRR